MPAGLAAAHAAIADARAALDRGERAAAFARLDEVPDLLAARGDDEARAVVHAAAALAAYHQGDLDRCLTEQAGLIDTLARLGDRSRLADALIRDAGARMSGGRDGAHARLDEGIAVAREIGDLGLEARAAATRAMLARREGRPDVAVVSAAEAAAAARRAEDWPWVVAADGTGAGALLDLGDGAGALRLALRALDVARANGMARTAVDIELAAVHAMLAVDKRAEAARRVARLQGEIDAGDLRMQAKLQVAASAVARAEGDLPRAFACTEAARAGWARVQDRVQVAEALTHAAELALELEDADAALAVRSALAEAAAPPALGALAEARLALLLDGPEAGRRAAVHAAHVSAEAGVPRLQDDALLLVVRAARALDGTSPALEAALALADARASANRRILEVRAAADAATEAVTARADAVDRETALGPAAVAVRSTRLEHIDAMERLAHRARNALAAVLACGEMLAMGPAEPRRSQLRDRLVDGVGRMRDELDAAVDLARGQSEGPGEGLARLAPLAHRVGDLYGPHAEQKGIALAVRVHASVSARVAPSLARDVLENLVSNAVKFCSAGNTVVIHIRADDQAAVMEVVDDGPGIPARDHERVFQPRTLSANRPTGGEPTTGLGLALVREATLRVGGSVRLESEVGAGARFEVRLPAA